MIDLVEQTLKHWRRSAFDWSEANCMTSVADYAMAVSGRDPAAKWRGSIGSKADALAAVRHAGGGAVLMGRQLLEIGFAAVTDPQRGDIVSASYGPVEVAGVCTGPGVAFRAERGVMTARLSILQIAGVWRWPS